MARARARGNSKKRATVSSEPCVQILIKGYKRERPKDGPCLPMLPDDSGLVSELLGWLLDENIYSIHTPRVGGGAMVAYFTPEDATRVLKWLDKNNQFLDPIS
ncbi:MAG: hypothetical protein ACXABY_27480 [Candidatus Thorarchaeota archaeon]|jgi:hypothetical protein